MGFPFYKYYLLILERKWGVGGREGGREGVREAEAETWSCHATYSCLHWLLFLYVPGWSSESATLAYRGNALTN